MTRLLTILLLLTTTVQAQNHYNLYEQADFVPTDDQVQPDGVIYRVSGGHLYKRVYTGGVNVRWFGAKGDGRTDDTKAIQTAINSYRNVYIPEGWYLCGPIRTASKGQKIYGDGHLKTILYAAKIQPYVLALRHPTPDGLVEENSLSDLDIHGRDMATTGLDVSIINSEISRIWVTNCTGYGIVHHRGFTSAYTRVYSMYNGNGILINQEGNLLPFISCVFSMNSGDGVRINSGSTNLFTACSIEHNKRYGVLLTYQTDSTITYPPYIITAAGMNGFQSCFMERNGVNFSIQGGDLPEQRVYNTEINLCHFGDNPDEIGIELRSGYEGVSITNSWVTNLPWRNGLRIGQSYLTNADRARVFLRGNLLPVESVFIQGAYLNQNREIASRLLGVPYVEVAN